MAVNNIIKRIQNIMRSDAGINGDAQRIEQMTWMFFLKVYDTQEETWEYKAYTEKKEYESIIPEPLRWRNWAIDEKDGKAMTGDVLLNFINNVLFPVIKGQDAEYNGETIKGIVVSAETPRYKSIVQETFADLNQYMKDGTLLRQVVNIVNEIEFDDADDRHTFGDIYEGILKDLQSAGNAGEFYTPRALTDFIVKMLNPQLGETFGDFTSGTGGFLTSALNHMSQQVKSAADGEKLQHAVIGQEWKPLPYLLSITNLLLHDIDAPNIRHCDSLGTNVSDFKDSDKVDVIGMNPPYGGSTGTSVQSNFPSAYRSAETANLFIALIMYRLKAGGRCGVIISDSFLSGTDGAELALKENLLRKFNLHTIIRLPGSIFSPYTSIATNILFFDNEKAEGAAEGFRTKETWFYRLDMPEGYKHFSKTKPMKVEHCQPIMDWWNDRKEIVSEESGDKSRVFTAQQLMDTGCNFDQCKFPQDEEEVLPPDELLKQYHKLKDALNEEIENVVLSIEAILKGIGSNNTVLAVKNPCGVFAELISNLPDRLKNSILQEAIMGKLVPQDPNDEPASVLLDQIREEKKRLVKDGKLKKKDLEETPISEDEIPFEIPEYWEWVRLGDVFEHSSGKQLRSSDTKGSLREYITTSNLYWGQFELSKLKSMYYKDSEIEKCTAKKGDLLVCEGGDVGRSAIWPYDYDICLQNHVHRLRPYDSRYTIFVFYIMWFYKSVGLIGGKGIGIKGLSALVLKSIIIPIPPLAEQKRIVAKIEEVFKEIDKLKTK